MTLLFIKTPYYSLQMNHSLHHHRQGAAVRRLLLMLVVSAGMALGSPTAARAATPEQVEAAIKKATEFLLSTENLTSKNEHEHFWEMGYGGVPEEGGATALAVYALLAVGVSPKDPGMASAIEYLKGVDATGIYALGLRLQVWRYLPFEEVKTYISSDAISLLRSSHAVAGAVPVKGKAFYDYERLAPNAKDSGPRRYDHSNSQYGVLGLWAAAECNAEIPHQQWVDFDQGWRAHQLPDGGWSYMSEPNAETGVPAKSTVSMTVAGIATLFLTQQQVHAQEAVECRGNVVDKEIEKGLDWMAKFYSNPVHNYDNMYVAYGIERIGVASGRKYLADVDWFQDGATYVVRCIGPNGGIGLSAWGGATCQTAWGLLFLVHGRAPVAINKLQYDIEPAGGQAHAGNWNERPRDAANFVKWSGRQIEGLLNWQVVDLKRPVEDLHDAPLLYIAGGRQQLAFSQSDMEKLKTFVDQGGIIVGNADCADPTFAQSFKSMAGKMYDYEFTTLAAGHILYTEQFKPDQWKNKPQVEILSNGARILMVLFPNSDPARSWQVETRVGHEEAWQLMQDLFLYSIDKKGLRAKGATYIVKSDPKITATQTIKVARLQYPGNWDPEPGGWKRLAAVMHNQNQIDLAIEPVKLGDGKLNASYKVAHLTGTYAFKLNNAAKDELRQYVNAGGTLVTDAAGGGGDFLDSAQTAIAETFSGAAMNLLRLDNPIFAGPEPIQQVSYRPFARKIVGATHTPRLRGIDINGRTAVIFSAEDLSVGLVGQEVDGINGYSPASATSLMRNILGNALNPRVAPAGAQTATTEPAVAP